MHMICRRIGRIGRGARTERGAVAIIVAVSMLALVVAGAMVLDFGIIRVDRQQMKLSADDAVMSGLRSADGGTADIYTYRGVCGALSFLKANQPVLSGLSDDFGTCTSPNLALTCDKSNPFAAPRAAYFKGSVTSGDTKYTVTIKSPYLVSDGGFPEESYASLSSDTSAMGGCDQLGIIISLAKKPGLGSIARSADLRTRLRSVGRIQVGDGDDSPALLLLERSSCGVLSVGSSGSSSRIRVLGSASPPSVATIHSDSSATDAGCGSGSNKQLFQGHQSGGIIAYGDGTKSGKITSVATQEGKAANIVQDGLTDTPPDVYSTSGLYPTTSAALPVQPRGQVTRTLVDKRYLPGVSAAVQAAYLEWTKTHAGSVVGYTNYYGCPSASDMSAMALLDATKSVYIDCPGSGITLTGTIGAGTIYFHGFIKGGVLNMPNATKVYVDDTNNAGNRDFNSAIILNNNNAFCVRAQAVSGNPCDTTNTSNGKCSTTPTGPGAKAQLFIRRGMLSGAGTSSLLRLCNTTVIMEGGQLGSGSASDPGGCLPMSGGALEYGSAPKTTPCVGASTSAGTSQVNTSGSVDWTAPNAYEDLKLPPVNDVPAAKQALWDGGEDLALWDETYADNSGSTFGMQGGGLVNVAGVFMVPNANPFNVTGTANLDLSNSQFIVRKFSVDGGAILTMKVDPYNAVPLPKLTPFTLVR